MAAPTVEALLARLRRETGGSVAAFLPRDERPVVADAEAAHLESAWWRATLADVRARWSGWRELDRSAPFVSAAGSNVLADWLAPHGVLLVEIGPTMTIGLARLRVRPLVAELQRVLDGEDPEGGGDGGDARPLH